MLVRTRWRILARWQRVELVVATNAELAVGSKGIDHLSASSMEELLARAGPRPTDARGETRASRCLLKRTRNAGANAR